jgi:3-oxoacyl-[acyl-carrier protein] reductase
MSAVEGRKAKVMSTVLITGGSRGIGAAAVRLFAARGDRVLFLYEKDHAAARAVEAETGAQAICCDVADGAAVRSAVAGVDVDILICNAGICHTGLISQITEEQWDRLFAVNVKGIYNCVNGVLPSFLGKQAGCIITVSSMWGQVGASCEAAYSATKGAVIALTQALAKELGPSGIRVNAVAPGVIATDMCANVDPQTMEELRQETPVGRIGTPEDVAKAFAYLADADFITGQTIAVNGGIVI